MRKVLILAIVVLSLSSIISVNVKSDYIKSEIQYTQHTPIIINNQSDFINYSFNGTGTPTNPFIIENLEIDGMGLDYCIYIGNTSSTFIIYNCFLFNTTNNDGRGVYFFNVTNGNIINNMIYDNDQDGILLFNSNNNSIENNTVVNQANGIAIWFSSNNTIRNNTVIDTQEYGIHIFNSDNNRIEKNMVQNNSLYGFCLQNSNVNRIFLNSIINNFRGILLSVSSNNNFIHNNTIKDSQDLGLKIINIFTTDNWIYSNNIVNNNNGNSQAEDDVGNNHWNTTSGGNYWNDWTSPDSNVDGIVDNPYVINATTGAIDYYPLAIPVNIPVPEAKQPPIWPIFLLGIILIAFLARKRF